MTRLATIVLALAAAACGADHSARLESDNPAQTPAVGVWRHYASPSSR